MWMLFLEKAVAGEEGYFDSAAHHCKSAVERAQVRRGRREREGWKGEGRRKQTVETRSKRGITASV